LLEEISNPVVGGAGPTYFPEVWDEWRGVVAVLQRMLDVVGA